MDKQPQSAKFKPDFRITKHNLFFVISGLALAAGGRYVLGDTLEGNLLVALIIPAMIMGVVAINRIQADKKSQKD